MVFLTHLLFACLFLGSLCPAFAQDGLYADFITSSGNFTCRLEFEKTPRTVANFVSLATGLQPWLDFNTGAVLKRPYFDGQRFYNVLSGFKIASGSPAGNGTDGPGYTFRDEFDASLRHDTEGVLSMVANGPHSNGSQFFLTLSAQSALDDVNAVFGKVIAGMDVVRAIGAVQVALDDFHNYQPLVPVTLDHVTIRRIGAAALAFDPTLHGLPSVTAVEASLLKMGSGFELAFSRPVSSDFWMFDSADLTLWTNRRVGFQITGPPPGNLDVSSTAFGQGRHFYRVAQIAYPGPLYTPVNVAGQKLHFVLSASTTLDLVFNQTGGGTTSLVSNGNPNTGTITRYTWGQAAYRGELVLVSTNLSPLTLFPIFSTSAAGTFKGTSYSTSSQIPLSGTVSLAPAPEP